jgi:hypothetical protein
MSWQDYDRALIINELSHAMARASQSCDNQRNMSRRELIISEISATMGRVAQRCDNLRNISWRELITNETYFMEKGEYSSDNQLIV